MCSESKRFHKTYSNFISTDAERSKSLQDSHSPSQFPTYIEKSVDMLVGTVPQTGVLMSYPISAICVQNFDDSLSPAIHTRYRISLRSSSLREPRYPLLRVVFWFGFIDDKGNKKLHKASYEKFRLTQVRQG
jgi:hypothetical protein